MQIRTGIVCCVLVVLMAGATSPGRSVTGTPAPTQEIREPAQMTFVGANEMPMAALYYRAPVLPAPAVVLLHGYGGGKEGWSLWAPQWSTRGFNVFALDLRGFGTGDAVEIGRKTIEDILRTVEQINGNPAVVPHQTAILGASLGGGYALVACAKSPDCKTAILLSGTNYKGDLDDPIKTLGKRPLFIAVSRAESPITETDLDYAVRALGEHRIVVYEGGVHATGLLYSHPELVQAIGDWLLQHLTEREPATTAAATLAIVATP